MPNNTHLKVAKVALDSRLTVKLFLLYYHYTLALSTQYLTGPLGFNHLVNL